MERLVYNRDKKFDLQLSQALLDEQRLGDMLANGRIELKSESWLWERTGFICIEYMRDNQPSGLSVTEADAWVHELKRDGRTLLYLVIPVERLKELCRAAIKAGHVRHNSGDGKRQSVVLLNILDLLR